MKPRLTYLLTVILLALWPPHAPALESQIMVFDGGKNSRLEPHLIKSNEAQEADSVDVSSGALKPLKGLGTTLYGSWQQGCAPNHDKNLWHGPSSIYRKRDGTWLQGSWDCTFAEWNDRYLRTFNDGGMRMLVEDLAGVKALVGLTGPSQALTVAAQDDRLYFAMLIPIIGGIPAAVEYFQFTDANGDQKPDDNEITLDSINDEGTECPLILSYSAEGSGEANEFVPGPTYGLVDTFYVGAKQPFRGLFLDFITPGKGEWELRWEYCTDATVPHTSAGWKALTVTQDTSEHFTKGGGVQWVTWENEPDDWVPSSVTQLYVVRCVYINMTSLKEVPVVRRIWPVFSGTEDAEKLALTGSGGSRRYLYTWVYKSDDLVLESHPALPGWSYDSLKAEVDTGAYSKISITIPTATLTRRLAASHHATGGMELVTDLDNGTETFWEVPVTHVRIYRTEADKANYYLSKEIPLYDDGTVDDATYGGADGLLTQYIDRAADSEIIRNQLIDDAIGNNPPVSGDGANVHKAYPAYIYEHNGSYFFVFRSTNADFNAKVQKKLFWSKVKQPHYIPIDNYIEFEGVIQGINRVGSSLLVTTSRGPFLITGVTDDTYFPTPILAAEHYDCAHNGTIAQGEGYTMWASSSGIILCDGRTAREIATTKLGEIDFSSARAGAFWDKQYIIFGANNAVITDMRYGEPRFFAAREIYVESTYLDPDENTLYVGTQAYDYDGDGITEWVNDLSGASAYPCGENEAGIRKWAAGNNLTYKFKTRAFTGQKLEEVKVFDRVEVAYEGTVDVTLYLDGVAQTGWGAESLSGSGREDIFFDQTNFKGRQCSIYFEGTGTIKEATVKYDWLRNFAERKIWRGAVVYHSGTIDPLNLYLDGTLNDSWTCAGDQHHQVHFTPNSQGYIPRAQWSGGNVIDIKWIGEDYGEWPGRDVFHGARISHSEDVTVKLYLTDTDETSNLHTTKDLTGNSVSDVFFPANTRGVIPSVVWYDTTGGAAEADLVRKVQWLHDPPSTFYPSVDFGKGQLIFPRKVYLNHEGTGTAYVYADGDLVKTIPFGPRYLVWDDDSLIGLGENAVLALDSDGTKNYWFDIATSTRKRIDGRVFQVTYEPLTSNSGWIHNWEFWPSTAQREHAK